MGLKKYFARQTQRKRQFERSNEGQAPLASQFLPIHKKDHQQPEANKTHRRRRENKDIHVEMSRGAAWRPRTIDMWPDN
jgi:hypothetical protein